MDQRRRHLHVADLTCLHCAEKDAELAQKAEIIHRLSVHNTELTEELSGAMEANRAAGKEISNLKRNLTKQANASARAEQVEAVIAHWRKHRPKTTKTFGKPGGKNWALIEKALVLMEEDEAGPVGALKEAIDGLHIAPWWSYGKRYMNPAKGRELKRDLEHALGDETRIERCRGIVRRVRADDAELAWELWQVAMSTETTLACVVLEKLGERGQSADRTFEVEGVVTQEDG